MQLGWRPAKNEIKSEVKIHPVERVSIIAVRLNWLALCRLQVLRSFEVAAFLINKMQNPRNADAFRGFFVKLSGKGAVQNRFISMALHPSSRGIVQTVKEPVIASQRARWRGNPFSKMFVYLSKSCNYNNS